MISKLSIWSAAASLAVSMTACTEVPPDIAVGPRASTHLVAMQPPDRGPAGVRDGIRVWLQAGRGLNVPDGGNVLVWSDQSGNGNDARWRVANAYGELPPVFDAANPAIGPHSSVRFNEQNALELDLSFLASSDYTVIVVNGRDRGGLANFYIAGDTPLESRNLVLGYEQPALLRLAHFNNDVDAIVEPYLTTEIWSIDSFQFSASEGRSVYHNGIRVAGDRNGTPLVANTGTTLGHFRAFPGFWYRGDLVDVVVYDRALTDDERGRIEQHFASRYELSPP